MSSQGAAIAAVAGRGISADSSPDSYRVVLPPLPSGDMFLNSVLLHADITGRPYRIEDFKGELQRLGVLPALKAGGAYQMNHVWLFTFQSPDAPRKLLDARELRVKEKKCLVVDPNDGEVRLKLHWLPFHVSDEAVRRALEQYGKVSEITRDTWRTDGFAGVQSTTRFVKMTLKNGVTKDTLPHQMRVQGGNVLVLVPGRAPLCLRCKKTGHIRRDCRVPRCEECNRVGHEKENCARTYAAVTEVAVAGDFEEHAMDEEEAEAAATSATPGGPALVVSTPSQDVAGTTAQEEGDSRSKVEEPPFKLPCISRETQPLNSEPEGDTDLGNLGTLTDVESEMSDSETAVSKQPADVRSADGHAAVRTDLKRRPGRARRERFNPKPRIPTEERRRAAPP